MRREKSEMVINAVEFARYSGKTIFVGTLDPAGMARRISERIPGSLCDVKPSGVVPHFPKRSKSKRPK